MMKAALKYYRISKDQPPKVKITLGQLIGSNQRNSSATIGAKITTRTRRPEKVQYTAEEQALLQLANNGQIGSLIAYHAPQGE